MPEAKSVSAQMKYVRQDLEADQKRIRRAETMELNKISHAYKPKKQSEFGDRRNRAFRMAAKRGISEQDLKNCNIDIVRYSSGTDIERVANGIAKVREGTLKSSDIGIYFNDSLTSRQQTMLYQAVMDCAGNRDKLDLLEMFSRSKYTAAETKEAVKLIKSGCSRDKLDAMTSVTELKRIDFFDEAQKHAIQFAYDKGLSRQQIMRIAKPQMNADQMREIIEGYQNGLSEKQIALFASPQFSAEQMHIISYCLSHGTDIDSMKKIAKPSASKEEIFAKGKEAAKRASDRSVPMKERINKAKAKEKKVLPTEAYKKRVSVRNNDRVQ